MTSRPQTPGPRQASALEFACRQIVQLIDLGTFQAGQRLPAADELASIVGVSRPIILQALAVLQEQGRVQVRRGSGAWVLPLSAANVDARRARVWQKRVEILQMCALREMLEVGVARRLAEVGLSDEQVAEARSLIQAMQDCTEIEHWRPLDTAFHSLLAGALGMPILEELLIEARAQVAAAFAFITWPPDREHTTRAEHVQLLEAIVARRPDEAGEIVARHVGVAGRLIEELLGGDGSGILQAPIPDVPQLKPQLQAGQ